MLALRLNSKFYKTAAIAAFLSVGTTLCVHLLPGSEKATTFDERIALHRDLVYLAGLWIVLLHILLVTFALWAIGSRKLARSPGLIGMGLFGYFLFAIAELFRTSLVLFALNRGWRAQYEVDPGSRELLRPLILAWPSVNAALFFLLILGFSLGNLLYGFALLTDSERRLDRFLGTVLLLWGFIGAMTIMRDYAQWHWIPGPPEWVAWTYQPLARVLIGSWLWSSGTAAARPKA